MLAGAEEKDGRRDPSVRFAGGRRNEPTALIDLPDEEQLE